MKSIATAIATIALCALVGGCAHGAAGDPFEGTRRPIRIDVRNLNFSDASVFAVFRSERIRLGTVTGKSESSFQLPWKGTEPLHMEIDLVAGERCITDELTVDEGDVFYLEISLQISEMDNCIRP
jgi:hypothetical protein